MIVAIDGKKVGSADDVVTTIASMQAGDTVEIQYYRGADKHTANVKLGERPKQLNNASSQSQNGLPFQLP